LETCQCLEQSILKMIRNVYIGKSESILNIFSDRQDVPLIIINSDDFCGGGDSFAIACLKKVFGNSGYKKKCKQYATTGPRLETIRQAIKNEEPIIHLFNACDSVSMAKRIAEEINFHIQNDSFKGAIIITQDGFSKVMNVWDQYLPPYVFDLRCTNSVVRIITESKLTPINISEVPDQNIPFLIECLRKNEDNLSWFNCASFFKGHNNPIVASINTQRATDWTCDEIEKFFYWKVK